MGPTVLTDHAQTARKPNNNPPHHTSMKRHWITEKTPGWARAKSGYLVRVKV